MSPVLEQLLLMIFKQFLTPEVLKSGETHIVKWLYAEAVAKSPALLPFVQVLADELGITVP